MEAVALWLLSPGPGSVVEAVVGLTERDVVVEVPCLPLVAAAVEEEDLCYLSVGEEGVLLAFFV